MKKSQRKTSLLVELPERKGIRTSLLPCNLVFHRLRKLLAATHFIFSGLNNVCTKKKKRWDAKNACGILQHWLCNTKDSVPSQRSVIQGNGGGYVCMVGETGVCDQNSKHPPNRLGSGHVYWVVYTHTNVSHPIYFSLLLNTTQRCFSAWAAACFPDVGLMALHQSIGHY